MILPIVAIAMPVKAEINGPVMWVNPNNIVKKGPCLVSETFDIEVKLWNKKDLTGVGVYGFDFTIDWSGLNMTTLACPAPDAFISLVSVVFTSPWDHYFVIVDEINNTAMTYHLAITALDGSDALTEVQVVLATLTFHIDCEPLYPDTWSTIFDLSATLSDLVDGKPVDVPLHEVDDGAFTLSVAQPDVELKPEEFCEFKVDMPHTIEFWLSNINKVYGFGFAITYPNLKLTGDVQSVVISDCFPPPYEYLHFITIDNLDNTSTLVVEVVRPCEKPTVTHCEGPIASFSLNSIYDFPEHMIPLCQNDTITLTWAYVLAKCGCEGEGATVTYGYGVPPVTVNFALKLVDGTVEYWWRPRIGDLNLDGVVDIQDLMALAAVYGENFGAGGWGDLDNLGNFVVDIYDFAMVAKYFGKPYVCDPKADVVDVCWPN
jgi:hypothetical protein